MVIGCIIEAPSVGARRRGLYRRSGLLGLSDGRSGDTRELVTAAADGDRAATLAIGVYTHRVRREIAAAATNLDRLDAIVFTGEIGWDQPEIGHDICAGLALLGVTIPVTGNREQDGPVSSDNAAVPARRATPRGTATRPRHHHRAQLVAKP